MSPGHSDQSKPRFRRLLAWLLVAGIVVAICMVDRLRSAARSGEAIGASIPAAQVNPAPPPAGNGGADAAAAFAPDNATYQSTIRPFFSAHCIKCHGPDKEESGLRLDTALPNDFLKQPAVRIWSEVLDKLNAGEMPPKKEPRPPVTEVQKVTDWIVRERLRGERARRGTDIVLRRLNRAEYNNTIAALTGVDMQPADDFPADPPAGGFDNNGAALSVSPLQLDLYVTAARRVLDRAIVTQKERPAAIKWHFEIEDGFPQGTNERGPGGVPNGRYIRIDGQEMYVNPGDNLVRDGMTVLRRPLWQTSGDARFGHFKVPHAGYYIVRARAAAAVPGPEEVFKAALAATERRQDEEEAKSVDAKERKISREAFDQYTRPDAVEHFKSRHYQYGPPRLKLTSQQSGVDRILGEFDVAAPQREPATYEVRAWFEPAEGTIVTFNNVYHIPRTDQNFWLQGRTTFPRPELLIDWMEVEGPLYDTWPPRSHQMILIDSPNKGKDEDAYARDVLANFMKRAYRRPLRAGEVESKLRLFREARPNHPSFEEAIKAPLVAVLSSPNFLYMTESATDGQRGRRTLSSTELATRLSYFLWSEMPDAELSRLGEQGKLTDLRTLIAQADRLLSDPRSEQLVKNFAGQWLKLRDVGANPPAPMVFLEYDDHLEASMRGESEAFVAHILRKDLSVLNFLRSDFLTINERMARFYGIPGVKGDQFREVKVPDGANRGGVVTQGSVLTVTSNGTRTSPVRRGVWILERLLGDPPAPPPPNAGEIPPSVPGINKATVRERLRIHREQPQCAYCHNKIDPLGFALENFDASGQWRDREAHGNTSETGPNDPQIDARAQLPGGNEFVGVAGLQEQLLKRQDQFLRCLAEKLYTYALGREPGYADDPTIADAVRHMKQNRLTMRSLIHHIVSSEAFRSK